MTEPPFTGLIEFKLAFRAFDENVKRTARAVYAYTPQWSYFHVGLGQERQEQARLELGLTLLALPRSDRNRIASTQTKEPYWVPFGQLLTVGVLRAKVYDHLRACIDAAALNADRNNRVCAGLPVLPLPEQI